MLARQKVSGSGARWAIYSGMIMSGLVVFAAFAVNAPPPDTPQPPSGPTAPIVSPGSAHDPRTEEMFRELEIVAQCVEAAKTRPEVWNEWPCNKPGRSPINLDPSP